MKTDSELIGFSFEIDKASYYCIFIGRFGSNRGIPLYINPLNGEKMRIYF